jgi:hypothetical protein
MSGLTVVLLALLAFLILLLILESSAQKNLWAKFLDHLKRHDERAKHQT